MFYPFFCSFVSSVILFGELILFTIQADLLLVSPGSSLLVERCHKKSEERVSAPPVAAKVGQKRQRDGNQGEDPPYAHFRSRRLQSGGEKPGERSAALTPLQIRNVAWPPMNSNPQPNHKRNAAARASSVRSAMFIETMPLGAIKLRRSGMFPGARQVGKPVGDQIVPLLRSSAEPEGPWLL